MNERMKQASFLSICLSAFLQLRSPSVFSNPHRRDAVGLGR
jgi:hypothetical protein